MDDDGEQGSGRPASNSGSKVPRLSADGSLVVFKTLASNLVPLDRNRLDDVVARRIVERP